MRLRFKSNLPWLVQTSGITLKKQMRAVNAR